MTVAEFIMKSKNVHGLKYDYSKVEYVNSCTNVCIICPKHGEFLQTPNHHLMGCGCPKCSHQSYKDNTAAFIQKARNKHGMKYDYSKVEYVNSHEKVCITCPKHGEFWQTPTNHLSGRGCNCCKKESLSSLKSSTKSATSYIIIVEYDLFCCSASLFPYFVQSERNDVLSSNFSIIFSNTSCISAPFKPPILSSNTPCTP